jgi:hypothetical protein
MTSAESLLKAYLASGDAGDGGRRGPQCKTFVTKSEKSSAPAQWSPPGSKCRGTLNGTFAGVSADGRAFEVDQAIFHRMVGRSLLGR